MVQFAKAIRPVKKYVASSRPLETAWPNCILVPGDIRDNIRSLRADNPGTIVIFGSPGLGRSLAAAGEIDEFHFLIQPIAADAEPRLFRGLSAPLRFAADRRQTVPIGGAAHALRRLNRISPPRTALNPHSSM